MCGPQLEEHATPSQDCLRLVGDRLSPFDGCLSPTGVCAGLLETCVNVSDALDVSPDDICLRGRTNLDLQETWEAAGERQYGWLERDVPRYAEGCEDAWDLVGGDDQDALLDGHSLDRTGVG